MWEMKRSHKVDIAQHRSVDQEHFVLPPTVEINSTIKRPTKSETTTSLSIAALPSYGTQKARRGMSLTKSSTLLSLHFHGRCLRCFPALLPSVSPGATGPTSPALTTKIRARGSLSRCTGSASLVNDELQFCGSKFSFNVKHFIQILRGEKDAEEI